MSTSAFHMSRSIYASLLSSKTGNFGASDDFDHIFSGDFIFASSRLGGLCASNANLFGRCHLENQSYSDLLFAALATFDRSKPVCTVPILSKSNLRDRVCVRCLFTTEANYIHTRESHLSTSTH